MPEFDFEDEFDPMPEAPIPPSDEACCGSGCEPCVWDLYQEELREYREKLVAWQVRQQAKARPA